MAKYKFETPTLNEFAEVPELVPDTMKHLQTFKAKPEFNEALGFQGELQENWKEQTIEFLLRN